jgi:hypothetical protein
MLWTEVGECSSEAFGEEFVEIAVDECPAAFTT